MKIMVVFGTRPEAIKMCPVIKELEKYSSIETVVCVTGQHKEMLQQVLNIFQVEPQYNLDIMQTEQTLNEVTIRVLQGMKEILEKENPDIVLVHGDTTTAFASALACFYQQIPVGHIEAGLRTYDLYSPYPEEYNRRTIDLLSDYLFAPTETARANLLKEDRREENIYVTGNTVIDALYTTIDQEYHHEYLDWAKGSRLLLLTAHRRENLGHVMENMFSAVKRIADDNEDVKIVYPVHPNPKVQEAAKKILAGHDRIRLIEPLDVIDFHNFMANSYLILTDSGGIQEEASALGKPVLVMRDTTERPEGIKAGTLKLVGTSEVGIYSACCNLLQDENEYRKMADAPNPYGDGKASERIVNAILDKGKQCSI